MDDSWTAQPDDFGHLKHLLGVVGSITSMIVDDLDVAWPNLDETRRSTVAEGVSGLTIALNQLVSLETAYPAVRVIAD